MLFYNDRVAYAMQNAWQVGRARDYFYQKYKGQTNLLGANVTNFPGKFGLQGLIKTGIDPVEQFVGSYDIFITITSDRQLMFTLYNVTSFRSFLYGIGPSWNGIPWIILHKYIYLLNLLTTAN
jgi:hypothetical protein